MKKTKKIRLFTVLIALCMLVGTITACSAQDTPRSTEPSSLSEYISTSGNDAASPNDTTLAGTATSEHHTTVSIEIQSSTEMSDMTHSDPRTKGYGTVRHVELEDYTRLTLRANTAFGEDSRLWTLYEAVAITMPSTIEEFTIPSYLEGVGNIPYVIAHNISLSHFKHLIFDAGIEAADFSVTSSPIGYIQEITLPATLHTLIGYPFEWSNARQESYFFEENHHLDFTSPLITNNTFPSEKFPELQKIHVDENNPLFDSEDGILYQNNHLICIPQDYQSENGIVTIREGTVDLYMGAVVKCRNIKQLVIPDSVLDLNVRAIVATAEHPLTVVCSRGSAAAKDVEQFGAQYHLTVEYTD